MSIFAGDNIRSVPPIAVNQTDAAKALGVNPQTLKQWERAGKITGSRPGGKLVLYMVEDIRRIARLKKPVLSGSAALYFLFDKKELVYIGRSIDETARGRLCSHRRNKKFDRVERHVVKREDVCALERGLIAYHQPPLNRALVNGNPHLYLTLLHSYGFIPGRQDVQ